MLETIIWACFLSSFSTRKESTSQDAESTFASEGSLHKSEVANQPLTPSRSSMEMPSHPAPRTVTDEEINFVKTCLQRWRSEIEQDIQGWLFQYFPVTLCLFCLFEYVKVRYLGYMSCHCHVYCWILGIVTSLVRFVPCEIGSHTSVLQPWKDSPPGFPPQNFWEILGSLDTHDT